MAGSPLLKEVIGWDSREGGLVVTMVTRAACSMLSRATPVICQPTVLSTAAAVQ